MDAFRFKNDVVAAALIEYTSMSYANIGRIGGRPPNYPSHWLWWMAIGILMMVIGILMVVISIWNTKIDLLYMVTNLWADMIDSWSIIRDLWHRAYSL
jgi:hypothetical protein